MILQLFIGATLTALGALSMEDGTPLTVLAASNTVIAGLLGLVYNSGLPDRYKSDRCVFEEVEDFLKEVLDSGLIEADKTVDELLAECFSKYQDAKATVQANVPATYMPIHGAKQPEQMPLTLTRAAQSSSLSDRLPLEPPRIEMARASALEREKDKEKGSEKEK